MASDKSQFNQALRKWDNLHELGRYSESIQRGDVAILVSGYGLETELATSEEEVVHFQTEALEIATSCQLRGIGAFVVNRFSYAECKRLWKTAQYQALSQLAMETFQAYIWMMAIHLTGRILPPRVRI